MATILKKITVANVCGKGYFDVLIEVKPPEGEPKRLKLMRVFGVARKSKIGTTQLGEYVAFNGSFKALNLLTGEEFVSGKAIFPGIIEELLYGALGDDNNEVQFGFDIGIRYDSSTPVKYVFEVESLVKLAENDPLALLERTLPILPALAAPAAPTEPAAPAAPATPAAPAAPTEPVAKPAPAAKSAKGKVAA